MRDMRVGMVISTWGRWVQIQQIAPWDEGPTLRDGCPWAYDATVLETDGSTSTIDLYDDHQGYPTRASRHATKQEGTRTS